MFPKQHDLPWKGACDDTLTSTVPRRPAGTPSLPDNPAPLCRVCVPLRQARQEVPCTARARRHACVAAVSGARPAGLLASRFNQRVCALRFRYRVPLGQDWAITHIPFPRKETTLPVVLSPSQVAQLLGARTNLKYRTGLMTADAAGLRVSEVLHLRVSDIDSQRMVMRMQQGKDHKDRSVMRAPNTADPAAGVRQACPSHRLAVSGTHSRPSQRSPHPPGCVAACSPRLRSWPTRSPPIRDDTAWPRICSRPVLISAPSNSCSATAASAPPPVTPMSRRPLWLPPSAPLTHGLFRPNPEAD